MEERLKKLEWQFKELEAHVIELRDISIKLYNTISIKNEKHLQHGRITKTKEKHV